MGIFCEKGGFAPTAFLFVCPDIVTSQTSDNSALSRDTSFGGGVLTSFAFSSFEVASRLPFPQSRNIASVTDRFSFLGHGLFLRSIKE